MFAKNIVRYWRNIAIALKDSLRIALRAPAKLIALLLSVGLFLTNFAHSGQALAADNYSAATDTYQETRNPNRVNSTREELANSKLDKPDESEAKGESIYESVIDRVNQQRDTSVKTSNTETKSEP